jgi:hypothetical protein
MADATAAAAAAAYVDEDYGRAVDLYGQVRERGAEAARAGEGRRVERVRRH